MENKTRLHYSKLRQAVEKTACRKIATPRDFDFLAIRIADITGARVSPTTLKRFWGYIPNESNKTPREYTLNILALFVGYKDYDAFCKNIDESPGTESDFLNNKSINTSQLNIGDSVKIMWSPNRTVVIKYLGQDMYHVTESINSKLQVGDTFHCKGFIENEPLTLFSLHREGKVPTNYVCGRNNGIRFKVNPSNLGGVANYLNINHLAINGSVRLYTRKRVQSTKGYREIHSLWRKFHVVLLHCTNRRETILHETTQT